MTFQLKVIGGEYRYFNVVPADIDFDAFHSNFGELDPDGRMPRIRVGS